MCEGGPITVTFAALIQASSHASSYELRATTSWRGMKIDTQFRVSVSPREIMHQTRSKNSTRLPFSSGGMNFVFFSYYYFPSLLHKMKSN